MRLISFGCSFIYGNDLPDCNDVGAAASDLTWPALLAQRYGLEYKCSAGGGKGNLMILDRLARQVCHDPEDFFVIQWTYIDRFDYCDPDGLYMSTGSNDFLTLRPGDTSSQADFYFRNLHSEYRDKLTNILYIKTALDLLLEKHCRFVMTCLDDLVWCDRYHTSAAIRGWQHYIKPYVNFFAGRNFLDWSQYRGYAISSAGHPLQQAHEAAAQLMSPSIDAILHRV